jgi:ActR/RegA family two-component response regulator
MTSETSSRNVLLIDDDELVSASLRSSLEKAGCTVDVALKTSAVEALLRSRSYEVIVVDPYLTGGLRHDTAALIDRVRELQPAARVIVLTAYASRSLLRIAETFGVDSVLGKPQPVADLSRLIVGAGATVRADVLHPKTAK